MPKGEISGKKKFTLAKLGIGDVFGFLKKGVSSFPFFGFRIKISKKTTTNVPFSPKNFIHQIHGKKGGIGKSKNNSLKKPYLW